MSSTLQESIPTTACAAALDTVVFVSSSRDRRDGYSKLLVAALSTRAEVREIDSAAAALNCLRATNVSCVVLDSNPRDMSTDEFIRSVSDESNDPPPPVILLVDDRSPKLDHDPLGTVVVECIPRPELNPHSLLRCLSSVMERQRLRTELRRYARDLEEAHKALDRRNIEIRSFYHSLSHELRTPLSAALEFLALVLENPNGSIDEQQRDYLETAHRSCRRVGCYVADMMKVVRLMSGQVTPDREQTRINELSSMVLDRFHDSIKRARVEVTEVPDPTSPFAYIDSSLIEQVLSNLLRNAIRFTAPGGRIAVSISTTSDETQAAWIRISVADTGCGIPRKDLDAVFDRLFQVERDKKSIEGLGLGLNICRDLVEMHGGRIWAESEMGVGSVFHFTVPRVVSRETVDL